MPSQLANTLARQIVTGHMSIESVPQRLLPEVKMAVEIMRNKENNK